MKSKHVLKMLMKNGSAIQLLADDGVLDELLAHPKFLRMRDQSNEVYLSIEDIVGFEITSNRLETSGEDEKTKLTAESSQ